VGAVLVRHAHGEQLGAARVQLVVVRLKAEELDRLAQLEDKPDGLVALGEHVLVQVFLDDVARVLDVLACLYCTGRNFELKNKTMRIAQDQKTKYR
jgi:hypothetical protein